MSSQRKYLLLLFPSIIVLLFLSIYPLLEAINLSVHDLDLRRPGKSRFIGLGNFIKLFCDNRFFNSLKVSFIYATASTIFSVLIGLVLALFVRENFKGKIRGLISFLLLLPFVVPRVSAAFMWKFLYYPIIGVYNYFLSLIKLGPIAFLASPSLALPSIIAVEVWQWSGFIAILIMSSLELMPSDQIEAAALDGADRLQLLRYIILPFLKPTLVFIILLRWIEGLRSFDLIFNMTRGGPGISTETLDLYAYNIGIGVGTRISYAAAMSLIMLLITIVITSVVRKWFLEK